MKKINTSILAVVAASLILVAGCYEGGVTQPPVLGYSGLIAAGWTAFEAGDYSDAMKSFQAAIEMDASRPAGFLGAGWCSIVDSEYWIVGDQYDYMAVQLDGGTWPVATESKTLVQDKNWTVLECIDPVLTDNDILVINSWGTTDSLVVDGYNVFIPTSGKPAMDNVEIGKWLYRQYSNRRFQYTFDIADPNVRALFVAANGFSNHYASVDSVTNGASASTVYLSVPFVDVKVGSDHYNTWCMYENVMTFEYATYSPPAEQLAFGTDAIAAYGILQNARGGNGDVLSGVAMLLGIADDDQYSFSHYSGITSLKMKGMAAAMAFSNQYFRSALGICRQAGYGLNIEVADSNFLVELMQVIETMLQ